ncbi:MAG: stage III sporulation AC/AD family protein [Ruminococcus sp.]|jgi:stage III sporulation protein AD|nr:stage III sporulation AC/AD family protein [Ruminococcus sp.]
MVDSCFQVAAFCIAGAIAALVIRQYCREQAMLLTLAVSAAVMYGFVKIISPVLENVREMFSDAGMSDSYISLLLKATAICFTTQILSEICRDSGELAIASASELWGRGALLVLSLPMLDALLETITNFL